MLNATEKVALSVKLVGAGDLTTADGIGMSEENLSIEALRERVRTGWMLLPTTPGLREAARDVIRPLVEGMRGQEIIYRCRVPWLMRVTALAVDDKGFRAEAKPIREIRDSIFSMTYRDRCDFAASWEGLYLAGSAICMVMITDHFFTDPALVAEVKAAADRGARPAEIAALLGRK